MHPIDGLVATLLNGPCRILHYVVDNYNKVALFDLSINKGHRYGDIFYEERHTFQDATVIFQVTQTELNYNEFIELTMERQEDNVPRFMPER